MRLSSGAVRDISRQFSIRLMMRKQLSLQALTSWMPHLQRNTRTQLRAVTEKLSGHSLKARKLLLSSQVQLLFSASQMQNTADGLRSSLMIPTRKTALLTSTWLKFLMHGAMIRQLSHICRSRLPSSQLLSQ